MDKGEPESFARGGLFDIEFFFCFGDSCRADHFIPQDIAQDAGIEFKGKPAQNIGNSGFGHNIAEAVTHAVIGADGTMELGSEDTENIGSGSADIDGKNILLTFLGDNLNNNTDGSGSGHNISRSNRHQFGIAGGLLHHVFQEQFMDSMTRFKDIFTVKVGADIIDMADTGDRAEEFIGKLACFGITAVNDGQFKSAAETRLGLSGADNFSDHLHVTAGTAVGTPGHKDHIGSDMAEMFNTLMIFARVIEGDGINNDRSGAECCAFGAGAADRADDAGTGHLQTAAGAACRKIGVNTVTVNRRGDQVAIIIQKAAAGDIL